MVLRGGHGQHCACGNGWRKCKLSTNAEGPLKPTLAMIAASIRASEFYAIEGVVMRLLGEWTAADELIAAAIAPPQ